MLPSSPARSAATLRGSPLGDPAKSQVDPKLAGYWMNTSDDEREIVALYPFDEHTYVVQDVKAKKEDNKWRVVSGEFERVDPANLIRSLAGS